MADRSFSSIVVLIVGYKRKGKNSIFSFNDTIHYESGFAHSKNLNAANSWVWSLCVSQVDSIQTIELLAKKIHTVYILKDKDSGTQTLKREAYV